MHRSLLLPLQSARLLGPKCARRSLVRRYGGKLSASEEEGSGLFKGTPKFTRVQPKAVRQSAKAGAKSNKGQQPEWGNSGRIELNSKNVGRLLFIGGATVAGVGLVGVAAYYAGTYFYLKSYWPVPEEVGSGTVSNLLYLATYYERLSPNHERAVLALEKALEMIEKHGNLASDSLVVLEIKIRMAECLYSIGDKSKASETLSKVLPVLQNKQPSESANAESSAEQADQLLYRLAATLGLAYLDANKIGDAKQAFTVGLQAVKRMKRGIVAKFDSEDLANYTVYDGINFKEANLTAHLARAFYEEKNFATAGTLFKGTLNATRQHKAHLDLAPRVVADVRTFKDDWACLDAHAMLYLAKIETDLGSIDKALPWIESARALTTLSPGSRLLQCINCEASLIAQLGHIAELQGDSRRALRRYREAYEYARLNFSEYQSRLAADVERLESNQ
ncbi:hypothetical protein GQ54DRAFT_264630 [Martensiomyces pterosporus]|nr:hypothetical protein GQ54DRAFT_264630 [Martensiomyces pterosporus]